MFTRIQRIISKRRLIVHPPPVPPPASALGDVVDLGHNFVLADRRCNNAKRDRIAAYDHLCAWVERNQEYGEQLAAEFRSRGVMHDLTASVRIAHWAYAQTEAANGLTWVRAEEMISLPETWRTSLGSLQAPAG